MCYSTTSAVAHGGRAARTVALKRVRNATSIVAHFDYIMCISILVHSLMYSIVTVLCQNLQFLTVGGIENLCTVEVADSVAYVLRFAVHTGPLLFLPC